MSDLPEDVRRILEIRWTKGSWGDTRTEERLFILARILEDMGPLREKQLREFLSEEVWGGYSQTLHRLLKKLRDRGHVRRKEPEGHSRHVVYAVEPGAVEQLKRDHLQALIEVQDEEDQFDVDELLSADKEDEPHVRPMTDLEASLRFDFLKRRDDGEEK